MEKTSVKFEVLMSCMHQENFDIAYRSKVESDLLIINQCDKDDYQEICVNGYTWRMISTTERGLSKSRNMALQNARGEICLLSDDDQVFSDGYAATILHAFEMLQDATVIAFNIHRIHNGINKKYYTITAVKEASKWRSFGSPMLAMKVDDLKNRDIWFNEKFGSGSDWGGGEETLLQDEIRKNHLKIYEYPETIATLDYSQGSQWFHGFDERYFFNVGAFSKYKNTSFFMREARYAYLVLIKLRKDKKLSVLEKLKWIHYGERGIKNDVPYRVFLESRQP